LTQKQYWIGVVARTAVVIAILYLAYQLIIFSLPLIYPFLIALLISLAIEPMVRRLEQKMKVPRWLSVSLILLLLFAIIFSLLIFVIAEIVVELTHLADFLPEVLQTGQQYFIQFFTEDNTDMKRIINTLQNYLKKNPDHQQKIAESISENLGTIANKGTQLITGLLAWLGNTLSNLPFYLTVLVFIILATFFISLDFPRLKESLSSVIPERIHRTLGLVLNDIKKALFGFARAQLILITITAILMLIGLLILKVPYAVTIALAVGVVDLLPYLGVGAVMVPWIIYCLLVGDYHLTIGLAIIYGVILVVRQVLEPRLLASTVGLDPLLTLIAIFIGLKLLGFLGIILGPVVVVILLALHRANVFKDIWLFIRGPKIEVTE
jgi:sporulation integral membrane protein YtvI